MLEWIQALKWQDWATAASFIFGLITLIAYIDQRRSAKQSQPVLEFARRHVSKDITEESIRSLVAQQRAIQDQINQNLPRLVNRAGFTGGCLV